MNTNIINENPEKYIMPIKVISRKEALQIYPKKRKEKMTYQEVKHFFIRKLEIYLKRNWIDKANKVAHILNILAEVMPKTNNPYLPKEYRKRMEKK